jgi:lipid A disaccharide synthetase
MSLTLNKKILILAGESSGDYIGSFLIDGLQDRNNKKLTFFGVGGPLMQKKGLNNKLDMNNLNIIENRYTVSKVVNFGSNYNKAMQADL